MARYRTSKAPTDEPEITPEVQVVITETPTVAPTAKINKATLAEIEAGKRALIKRAASK